GGREKLAGVLRLPAFARRFVRRAAELTGARSGALALFQDGRFQTFTVQPTADSPAQSGDRTANPQPETREVEASPEPAGREARREGDRQETDLSEQDRNAKDRRGEDEGEDAVLGSQQGQPAADVPRNERELDRILNSALGDLVKHTTETVVSGTASDLLGSEAANALGWENCTVVRLPGSNRELAGLLCLAGRSRPLAQEDRVFLEAMANHAAMALENARLFTRMEQANRHWAEIFAAITDLTVAHDEADRILRVNRSLAATIGVPPEELIGVNMRALLTLTGDAASYACPFCRPLSSDTDEFVHPVLDRTYLVSTSRVHGASSEGLQTVHVLKDITDRRE